MIAVLGAGAAFLLVSQDDEGRAGSSGTSPEEAAETFIEAARTQDCEAMVDLVSHDSLAGAGASRAEQVSACQQTEVVPYELAVTGVELVSQSGDTATVTVTAETPGGTDSDTVELVKEDGAWKVDLGPGGASATAQAPPVAGGG